MSRKLAIINYVNSAQVTNGQEVTKRVEVTKNIINSLNGLFDEIYVFSDKERDYPNTITKNIVVDIDVSRSQIKNIVTKFFVDEKFDGFLHVIEDNIEILTDPTEFIADVENMMTQLNYDIWMNTICDECNYVLERLYCPRIKIEDFPEEIQGENKLRAKSISITTHCNPKWSILNLGSKSLKENPEKMYYNEKFKIPMFYILDMLLRRRETADILQPYYYNSYLSVGSEVGVFKIAVESKQAYPTEEFNKEDIEFKNIHKNLLADNNMDIILNKIFDILYVSNNIEF